MDAAEGFEPIHAGKPNVEENDVESTVGRPFESPFRRFGGFSDVAFVGEDGREGFADASFVINDEDVWFRGHGLEKLSKYV